MTGRTSSTRQRMVDSAVELLATCGTAGTTIDAVLSASGAPRGSVYHHFPGGRDELVHSAVRVAGARMAGFIDRAVDAGEPEEVLAEFAAFWRRRLGESDFQRGCPIVALTVGGVDRGAGGRGGPGGVRHLAGEAPGAAGRPGRRPCAGSHVGDPHRRRAVRAAGALGAGDGKRTRVAGGGGQRDGSRRCPKEGRTAGQRHDRFGAGRPGAC